jgi:hypothetical protein
MLIRRSLLAVVGLASILTLSLVPNAPTAEEGFVKLFNGKDMTGFGFEPPQLKRGDPRRRRRDHRAGQTEWLLLYGEELSQLCAAV